MSDSSRTPLLLTAVRAIEGDGYLGRVAAATDQAVHRARPRAMRRRAAMRRNYRSPATPIKPPHAQGRTVSPLRPARPSVVEQAAQCRERAYGQRWRRRRSRPVLAPAIEPDRGDASPSRAFDVRHGIVTHVYHLRGAEAGALQQQLEDARVGLQHARLACRERMLEEAGEPDRREVR